MAKATVRKVGFECTFTEEPPVCLQKKCPVCLHILREPYQVTCCGKSFCKDCIGRVKIVKKPCPCCNGENFNDFPNKGLQQPLYEFLVHCSNKHEGCEWTGELGQLDDHLNLNQDSPTNKFEGCSFAVIECTYCSETFKRNELCHHMNHACSKRPIVCKYCNVYKSTYQNVVHNHWPVCGHHPVQCPSKCGIKLLRQNLKRHINTNCPLTVVECDFSYAGCEVKLPRQNMADHLRDSLVPHFSLLALSHKQQQNEIQRLKQQTTHYEKETKRQQDEIKALNKELNQLKRYTAFIPVDYVFNNLLETVSSGKRLSLEPFYSHCNGYKLRLQVYKNPHQAMIVFQSYLMQGEFDSLLKWPFKSVIKIQLQNPHGENVELKIKAKCMQRVRVQDGMEECGDVSDSVANITQCVLDSLLHIKVSVEFK